MERAKVRFLTLKKEKKGERKMKRVLGILLATLIMFSAFNSALMISTVNAQSEDQWPDVDINGDGKINLDDTIEYAKNHYVSYNAETGEYLWDYSDPYDTAMANYFMQSVLYVESIRDSNNDKSILEAVNKLIDIFAGGLTLNNFDGTQYTLNDDKSCAMFAVKNFLTNLDLLINALDPLFTAGELVDFLLGSGLSYVEIGQLKTELLAFLVGNGEEWLVKIQTETNWINLRFDSSDSPPTSMLGKVAGYFRVAMKIADFLNILMEHMMNIIQIGKASIMDSVKSHEIGVEFIRGVIEVVGKLVKEFVGKPIEAAYAKGLITVCAGLAVMGGPPGIVAAAIVGVAGVALYFAVEDIVDEGIEWLADETLTLDLAIYKRLASSPNQVYIPLYQVEVQGINTKDEDNYIPWGDGCEGEDVYVVVRNTGARTLNLRVEPEIYSVDPETGKTGWSIDDKQPFPDLDNWIEKEDLKPGDYTWWDFCFHVDSGTIDRHWNFDPRDDEWIPGENPGAIAFSFNHDWLTDWWDVFDLIGGLKYLDQKSAFFYNTVDTLITVHGGLDVAHGETVSRTIDVKNLKTEEITFVPEVHLRDSQGESEEYDPQIEVTPSEVTIDPQEVLSFNLEWTATSDAPVGFYSIEINGKDNSGNRYVDNLAYKTIFYLYELNIVFPKSTNPAKAGDPDGPNQIYVYVTGLPPLLYIEPVFWIWIGSGGAIAENEIVDSLPAPAGYTLKVTPPTMMSEGMYNLEVHAFWGEGIVLHSSDAEPNAVEYTSAPSIEPIEKGLGWLRTRQYGDGSWRSNVGVTSLTALAFLNAGYDETDPTVSKAINYILSKVHSDGSIYASYSVYETSTAILALVATYNENYATIIENAKNWLIGAQQDETFGYTPTNYQYGGWTYSSARGDPDLSNTQFALLALDAANLPKTDPTWSKAVIFTQRCQNRPASNDQAWAHDSIRPSYNDGGFIYRPWGWSLAGGTLSYGSMTGAGIWGLLLSGVPKTDERVTAAINWVTNHYTWDNNPVYGLRPYYYYLSMSKALTMYGEPVINGHDWYQELYNKLVGMQIDAGSGKGYWSTSAEDYNPDLTTAYAILSLQTRAVAPPVQRLSYLTFILRSNCLIRILDSEGNLVGYNYMTGLGENQIPTAVYSGPFSETQYIVIINPEAGTYQLELVGISEGPYELTIQGNYGEEDTDTFEYTGYIKPAELHGSDVTVTAIVGPLDIYTGPPEFEEIIDNIPPTTTLEIGEPKYVDPIDNIYVTSATSFTLTAEDNPSGTGVASIFYRIYNSPYDTGWLEYSAPFYLTGLSDGEYSIDYYSTDNIGNTETTNTGAVILDNTPPSIIVSNPPAGRALQDGVTFLGSIADAGSGVFSMSFSIREANDGEGTPIGFEDLPVSYNPNTGEWSFSFDTLLVPDGYYVLHIGAEDNLGNEASTTVPYSIRNWAVVELLPSSENNKARRTMPVKFALRVVAEVDPDQPFVYNGQLKIEIFAADDPDNVLQESYYGDGARDYRISSVLYITNFKTLKRPMEYTVAIYRDTFDVGSFTFETVK